MLTLLSAMLIPSACAISFTYSPENPTTTTSIHFSINTSIAPVSYLWDFGDGNFSSEPSPYHRYSDNGNYTIILTVIDNRSAVYQCNRTIEVGNTPPVVHFKWNDDHPKPFDQITFTDKSYDPDGIIIRWRWQLGDGATSYDKYFTHAFIEPGDYNITLTVWDDDNASSNKTEIISVRNNKPPDAVFVVKSNIANAGEAIQFYDKSVDMDGTIVSWLWDFGDGETSDEQNPVHEYKKSGDYNVTLTVWDDDNAQSSYTVKMHIEGNNTPGFSVILIAIAIAVSHTFINKKRI